MLQDIDLRSLSDVRGNGRDVVSAYFRGEEGLRQLQARERQLADLLSDDDLEAENFERSMATIRRLLSEHDVGDATSICFFCSEVLDLARGYPISIEVPDRLVVVLIGSEETMQAIEERLSEQLTDMIFGREPFDLDRSEDEMVERAYEAYFDEQRENERDDWQRIKGEAMRDGRATTGADDVLEAAKIGRVDHALITRDLKRQATMCRSCESVFASESESCRSCGSDDTFFVDYVDSLARHLELTSARLDFVDPIKGLTKVGDVAAMLRY